MQISISTKSCLLLNVSGRRPKNHSVFHKTNPSRLRLFTEKQENEKKNQNQVSDPLGSVVDPLWCPNIINRCHDLIEKKNVTDENSSGENNNKITHWVIE